jgi:DNA-binding transcriptional ArsR family regulator
MRSFSQLLTVLSSLEKEYGLNTLDAGERRVFHFIVESAAGGAEPSSDDILAADLGSRASVYRWIAKLRDQGLIEADIREGQSCYKPSTRLKKFHGSFLTKMKRLARQGHVPKTL